MLGCGVLLKTRDPLYRSEGVDSVRSGSIWVWSCVVHQKEPSFPCCRWRLLGAVTDFGQGQRIRNSEVEYR